MDHRGLIDNLEWNNLYQTYHTIRTEITDLTTQRVVKV